MWNIDGSTAMVSPAILTASMSGAGCANASVSATA
jgi:hypothetical protein